MARSSKSKKDNDNSDESENAEVTPETEEGARTDGDSSSDEPVVIEGEANEVEATSEPEADANAEEPLDDAPQDDAADEERVDAPEGNETPPEATDAGAEEARQSTPPPAVPATTPEPASSGPGALALVFGGILAGAIGYGASFLSPPPQPVIDPELEASVEATGQRLDALASDVAALEGAPAVEADLSGVETQLGDLSTRIDELSAQLTTLENELTQTSAALDAGTEDLSQRIAALENADPSGMPAASEDQIAAFRERLETITADAEARLASATEQAAELEAQAAARAEELRAEADAAAADAEAEAARIEEEAQRQAAIADLRAAMENGTPFDTALTALGESPEDLAVVAEKGVPTLAQLQRAYPSAARAALSAAVSVPEDASAGERFTAFLKRRTNARSLTPQEGSDPDAVLSRAEAAVDEGDLQTALSELETLPEPAQAAMQDWLDQARTRAAALQAVDGLTVTN